MDKVSQLVSTSDLVYVVIALVSAGLLFVYLQQKKIEQGERKRLKAFISFLDNMFYQYTIYESVEEALRMNMEGADADIQELAEEFYDLLMLEDEWELRLCKKEYNCSFYYQFVIYSYLAMQYGDVKEASVYLENVTYLKKQVFLWVLNREKLDYYLAGLIGVVLLPVQCLKLIEIWAKGNMMELGRYYAYGYGVVTRFLLVVITLICYQIILWLRQNYEVRFYGSKIISKISENIWVANIFEWWTQHCPKRVKKLTALLRMSSSRLTLQEFWILKLSLAWGVTVISFVILVPGILIGQMYLYLMMLLVCMLGVTASFIPDWILQVRIQLMNGEKEDESYFYYGIARMVALGGNGNVDQILEWMELSGKIFVPVVQVCMEEYAYDSEAALEHVKLLEPFTPFVKLIDAFSISEMTGLEDALRPLCQEYQHHLEKRKQDNEIHTANKGAFGRFIAFIPLICVVGLYLIIPFVLESLVQLREYINQIQGVF